MHSYTVYQHNLRDISARLTSSDREVDSDDSDDEAEERFQQTFTYVIPRLNVIFDSVHAIFQDPVVLLTLDHSRIRTSPWYVFFGTRRGCNGSGEGHLAKPCPSLCRLQDGTVLAENQISFFTEGEARWRLKLGPATEAPKLSLGAILY